MKKTIFQASVALIILIAMVSLTSAGYYYPPMSNYQYPSTSAYQYNAPSIINKVSNIDDNKQFLSRNYQGPIIQKDTRYDEFLKIGKSGRVTRTISATTSERYIGDVQNELITSEQGRNYQNEYNYIPNNPTIYSQDVSFRLLPTYDYSRYGPDRYGGSYYYSPRYDPRGYYNWRY